MRQIRKSPKTREAFEKWGIKAFSPSMLDCFIEDQGKWALRYIEKIRDRENPSMWRGHAIEASIRRALVTGTVEGCKDIAIGMLSVNKQTFDLEQMESLDPDERVEFEADYLDAVEFVTEAIERACEHILSLGLRLKDEHRLENRVELDFGLEIPFVGYLDLEFASDQFLIDVKSSAAMPSQYKIQWGPELDADAQVALGLYLDDLQKIWKDDSIVPSKYSNANYKLSPAGIPFRFTKEKKLVIGTKPLSDLPQYEGIAERVKRQVCSYAKARNLEGRLFYVGKSKCFLHAIPPTENERLVRQYQVAARAIRQIIQTQKEKEDIFSVCMPNFDGFRWDSISEAKAREIWDL